MSESELKQIIIDIVFYASPKGVHHMNIKGSMNPQFINDFENMSSINRKRVYLAYMRLRSLACKLADGTKLQKYFNR